MSVSVSDGLESADGNVANCDVCIPSQRRGVSVGGWLLLEPGPSRGLFARHRVLPDGSNGAREGSEATCEWELMEVLHARGALSALAEHRDTFITRADFERMVAMGLNTVRVPIGYWIVIGSTSGDPYVGPALEYVDRAVQWAEELGLQILLDLHGAPGGESAETPCGRRQRPLGQWRWRHWRFAESLLALEVLSKRYSSSRTVTGIAVCNEPAPQVPSATLCRFYSQAVATVRKAGMHPSKVTIVLPVFQRSLPDFARKWAATCRRIARQEQKAIEDLGHGDVCFEVHWYHCFENEWHGRTFAQHLRAVQEHAQELRNYPILVGEWSLALGRGAQPGLLSHKEEMRKLFAHAQLAAYREASHGWFFWSWSDQGGGPDWDWQLSYMEGCWPETLELPDGLGVFREPPPYLRGNAGGDPLERLLDVPASDPCIHFGDTIYLRAFNGCYLDVEGSRVRARYGDRGRWQQFVLSPASSKGNVGNGPRRRSSGSADGLLRDGDLVCLLAHTRRLVGVLSGTCQVVACWSETEAGKCRECAFAICTEEGTGALVRHRSAVFLRSQETSKVLAPNEGDPSARSEIVAKWAHLGRWQRLVIEKPLSSAVTPRRPRRRIFAKLLIRKPRAKQTFPEAPSNRRQKTGSACSDVQGVRSKPDNRAFRRSRCAGVARDGEGAKINTSIQGCSSRVRARVKTVSRSAGAAMGVQVGCEPKESEVTACVHAATPRRKQRTSLAVKSRSPGNHPKARISTSPKRTEMVAPMSPVSRRRTSVGAQNTPRSAVGLASPSGLFASPTGAPRRRRSSGAAVSAVESSLVSNTNASDRAALGDGHPMPTTPCRRRRGSFGSVDGAAGDPDELADLAFLPPTSRRRRISGGQELLSLLLTQSPSQHRATNLGASPQQSNLAAAPASLPPLMLPATSLTSASTAC
eukprot:TRINITY_DN22645_c0_g2_i1.p1 TRINITY_DN22645_c0_g2~~TRINITY_DN22645_c0_g2_i1.p1  ORF type:complete len:924 (-),score=94.27 TRINITY_DN22645_c0_g2_i1:838-3609(-)